MKKFSLLSILFFLLINLSAKAQSGSGWEWASVSGIANSSPGRSVKQIATDAANNVYATGFFHGSLTLGSTTITSEINGSTEAQNVFIAKYDAAGNVIWLKRYAGIAAATNQNVNAITVDGNGNIYIGGTGLNISTANSAFLVKYDSNGNVLWKKENFPLYEVNGVNIGPDGNPLVMESGAGSKNIYKIDKTNGNAIWTASCTGAGSNAGTYYKDFTDNAGNVYFTCFNTGSASVNILGDTYTTTGGSFDANTFIASVDNNGAKRWSQIIPIVQVQLSYTVDANGKSYIQIGGGFGSTFQGVSTASTGGNRYLELDNTGALTRYLPFSPYKGIFRVKSDGIYGYENTGGTTQAYTEVFGDYYFGFAAGATTRGAGIVIKYNPSDNDKVVWANSIELNGAAYTTGGISTFETTTNGKVIVGGNFVTSIKTGGTTYTTTASGSFPYDIFLAQFNGANVTLPPTTNWTGNAANGNWTDAGNWDNGVPNGNEKSVIPNSLTSYPSNVPATAITGKLLIDAGATPALPMTFNAKGGLINNGNTTVIGTGTFQGFNSNSTPFSGNGRLIFTALSPSSILFDIPQSLEINYPSGTISSYGGNLGGSLYLTNGKLSIALGSLNMTDPNATLTYSATSYISNGALKRAINTNGNYTFPVGGSNQYNPITVHLTNVVGPQNLTVLFNTSLSGTTPNLTFGASTISTLLNTGYWTITPSAPLTSGKYTLDLEAPKYTNGVTDPAKYLIIKRNNSTASWSLNGKKLSATQTGGTISGAVLSNGLLDISSEDLTEFNDFGIGIGSAAIANGTESGNTIWTGTAGNSLWTDAANWDNGVPTSSTNATISSGKSTYPTNITATNTAAKLEIGAAVNIKLPYNFIANAGIVNNGTIELTGSSYFAGFGNSTNGYSPLSGTGNLLFTATGPLGITTSGLANIINNNVEIKGSSFTMTSNVYLGGDVTLSNGTTLQGFTMYNPNATLSVDATSYATSSIIRYVNANGTYSFPFTNGNIIVKPNGLSGTQYVSVSQSLGQGGSLPNFVYNTETVNKYLNGGYFSVTPNAITTGNYDLTIEEKNATNTILDASKYLLINRTGFSNPWKFDGTKGASSQSGGISSANVTGLTASGQFGIGIIGQIVSNWTGTAANGVWANAGNWDNGIPNTSIKAAFASGLSSYPSTFPTAPATEAVSVASGASVKLAFDMTAPLGVVNDGTIEPIGSGTFSGFGSTTTTSIISGSGKILFSANSPATFSGLINNNVEVNRSGNLISNHGSVTGNITITNGFVIPPLSNEITLTNPNATISLATTANAFQNKLVRNVNANGTYLFPVGNNALQYNPVTLTTNGIVGTTSYGIFYSRITNPDNPKVFADGVPVNKLLNCDWTVYPNVAATAGTLNITFEGRNYNNGGVDVSRYVLIRKVLGGPLGYEALSNCTFTESAGVITASVTGLTPPTIITDYFIGVKGFTTTWTGAANDQNWATATNWDNGTPTADYYAKFIAGSPNYPVSVSSSNTAAALSIASGVSFKLSEDFNSPNGIINNGVIEVTGSSFFSGFNSGNSALSGTGKLVFGASGPTGISSSVTINHDIEITKGGTFTMSNVTLGGSLFMTSGIVSGSVIMTNPTSTITYSPTAYISGTLKRTVNNSGNYAFPVGVSTRYAPVILQLNNIVGPQNIIASFSTTINGTAPNITVGGRTVSSLLNSGIWTITPNIALTSGNYTVTLEGRGYTNGVSDVQASDYVVVKRTNSSSAWGFFGQNGTASQSASVATATAGNITGFSDFAIGIANGDVPTTLPVKLVDFIAKADGKAATLNWKTATEINNDRFEIERSLDGFSWLKIGEVKGAGNSYQLKNYSFRDVFPSNGDNYYRLKQLDADGVADFSQVKVVNFELSEKAGITVYPNPAIDILNVSGVDVEGKTVQLIDLTGKIVLKGTIINGSVNIPLSMVNGIYLLEINNVDTSRAIKVIVKR